MWVDIRRSPRRPSVRELACRLTTCSHGCLSVRRGGPKMRRWRWDPGFWLSSSLLCVALVSSAWIIAMLAIHCCGLDATIKCGPIIPLELWPTQHSGGKKAYIVPFVRVVAYSQCSTLWMLLSFMFQFKQITTSK